MPWIIGGAVAGGAVLNYMGAQDAAGQQAEATGKAAEQQKNQFAQTRADLQPYRSAGEAALGRLKGLLGLDRNPSTLYTGQTPLTRDEFDADAYGAAYGDVAGKPDLYAHYLQEGQQSGTYRGAYKYGDFKGDSTDSPLLKKFGQSDLDSDVVYNSGLQFGLDEGTKALERRAAAGGGYDSGATLKALTRFANDYGSTKAGDAYGRFRDNQDSVFGKLSGTAGMGSGATTVGVNAGTTTAGNLSSLYSGQGNAQAAATLAGTNAIAGGINSGIGNYYLSQLTPAGQRGATPSLPPVSANI